MPCQKKDLRRHRQEDRCGVKVECKEETLTEAATTVPETGKEAVESTKDMAASGSAAVQTEEAGNPDLMKSMQNMCSLVFCSCMVAKKEQ